MTIHKEQDKKLPEMSKDDHYNHNHFLINDPPNYNWGQQLIQVNYVSHPVGEHDKFLSAAEIQRTAERITKTLRENHYVGESFLVAHQCAWGIYHFFHSYLVDGGIIEIGGQASRYTPHNTVNIDHYESIRAVHTTENGLATLIRQVVGREL